LDWSGFIEGRVKGFHFSEDCKTVEITIRDRRKDEYSIILKGVKEFLGEGLRAQNIVDRINIRDSRSARTEYLDAISTLVRGKHETANDDKFATLIEDAVSLIEKSEAILFELEPVYGVYLIALAESVAVEQLPKS